MTSWSNKGAGSHNARSKGGGGVLPVEAIKVIVSELHEIWQVEEIF